MYTFDELVNSNIIHKSSDDGEYIEFTIPEDVVIRNVTNDMNFVVKHFSRFHDDRYAISTDSSESFQLRNPRDVETFEVFRRDDTTFK